MSSAPAADAGNPDSSDSSDDWFSRDLSEFVLEPRPPIRAETAPSAVDSKPLLQFTGDAADHLPFLPPQFSAASQPPRPPSIQPGANPAPAKKRALPHQQLQLLLDNHGDQLATLATHLLPTRSGFAESLSLGGGGGGGPNAAQRLHTAVALLSRLFATHAFRAHQLHLLHAIRGAQPHPLWSHLAALIGRTPARSGGQSAATVRLVNSTIRALCDCARNVRCTLQLELLAPTEASALLAAIEQSGYAVELAASEQLRWLTPSEAGDQRQDDDDDDDWAYGPAGLQRVAAAELMLATPRPAAPLSANQSVNSAGDYSRRHAQMLAQDFWHFVREGLRRLRLSGGEVGSPEFWEYGQRQIVLHETGRGVQRLAVRLPAAERLGTAARSGAENAGEMADAAGVGVPLMAGSLLLFATSRAYDELLVAVVAESHDDTWVALQPLGTINSTAPFLNCPLLMLESRAFFQPNQHVYRALSTINDHTLPALFAPLVCSQPNDSSASPRPPSPPAYLSASLDLHYESNATGHAERLRLPLATASTWPAATTLGYNAEQAAAIRLALTSRVALIQGPPGTGKSFVARELVALLLHNRRDRLLIISYTNQALDQLLLAVQPLATAAGQQLARLGANCTDSRLDGVMLREISAGIRSGSGQMHTNLWNAANAIADCTCRVAAALEETGRPADAERRLELELRALQAAHDRLDELRQLADFEQIRDRRVIGMTSSFAARNQTLLRLLQAPIVLVEEAAELLESHVLASLTAHTQHLILIGDPQQLRPSLHSPQLRSGLEISLFERLQRSATAYGSAVSCSRLCEQHRMHPQIADLLRLHIYPLLRDAECRPVAAAAVLAMPGRLQFIDHRCRERWRGTSIGNEGEARMVRSLCAHLLSGGYKPADITVLCTYRAQVALLATSGAGSPEARCHGARIAVLDGFQGCESHIVLLSLVRNNKRDSIGFLAEQNRVCVALSRAREALFMFGNMPQLIAASGAVSVWRSVADRLLATDSWRPADIGVMRAMCSRHQQEMRIGTEFDWNRFEKGNCSCSNTRNK